MFGLRICLIIALVAGATPIATAVDYTVPAGVTVLTEEQLLNQIIGNTLETGRWVEYFEPPTGDQKKGRFKGKAGIAGGGIYSGSWEVKEDLMCWQYDKRVGYNQCVTTVLDGDIVTWYQTNGFPKYNAHPPIKLISGNPENF